MPDPLIRSDAKAVQSLVSGAMYAAALRIADSLMDATVQVSTNAQGFYEPEIRIVTGSGIELQVAVNLMNHFDHIVEEEMS